MPAKTSSGSRARKRYYQIREVSEITGINESTLRNWEEQYDELKTVRRINNRRHYTENDIETIHRIIKARATKEPASSELEETTLNKTKQQPSKPASVSKNKTPAQQLSAGEARSIVSELRKVQRQLKSLSKRLS